MQTSLDQVCLGETVVVTDIDVPLALRRRLQDFGLVPGTKVECRYRHPGGNLIAVACRGAVFAMRTRDLRGIQVRC